MSEMRRICLTCGVEKDLEDYARNAKSLNGRQRHCKPCMRPAAAAYTRKWTALNAERKKTARKAEYRATRARVISLKLTLSCVDCGWQPTREAEVERLEFDHIDPATKWRPSGAAFNYSWSWARIEAELALCEPRCRECHSARSLREGHRQIRYSDGEVCS